MDVFVGIDLAIAKRKRLPICICKWDSSKLVPLELPPELFSKTPRGFGNLLCLDPECVSLFAKSVRNYLRSISNCGYTIRRIGIDAPMSPKLESEMRRKCELSMDKQAISCFATLSFTEFEEIRSKAKSHIERGGLESALPSANKIWMLAGFELFKELKKEWECIEVFPHATMKRIGAASITKNARGGPLSQLLSVARFTQWPERVDSDAIKLLMRMVGSPSHDAVDAYASAWIAALDESQREPLGCPPEDAIWVPKLPQ